MPGPPASRGSLPAHFRSSRVARNRRSVVYMDIRLLLRLISRFRYIAIAGVVLAVAATIFSAARLDPSTWQLKYRQKLEYQSSSVLLVDGNRPSWLYAVPPGSPTTTTATATASSGIADPARLGGLTSLYGYFVQSDSVRKLTGDDPDQQRERGHDHGRRRQRATRSAAAAPDHRDGRKSALRPPISRVA